MPEAQTSAEWVAAGTPPADPIPTPDSTGTSAPATEQPAAGAPPVADGATGGAPGDPAAPAATAKAEIEYLEAMLDGKPYQLPKAVQLKWKRGEQEGWESIEEVRRERLMHRDYTQKSQEVSALRREYDRRQQELEIDRARLEAEKAYLGEEAKRLAAAFEDPAAAQQYIKHIEQLRSDPHYRKMYDDALAKREQDAASHRQRELAQFDRAQGIAQDAFDYIERLATQYPGVEPARIRDLFARGLQDGSLPLHATTVDRLYQQEARYLESSRAPLQAELNQLKAQVEELKAAQHNARTDQALARGKPATTTPGAPPLPGGRRPTTSYLSTSEQAEQAKAEWIRGR